MRRAFGAVVQAKLCQRGDHICHAQLRQLLCHGIKEKMAVGVLKHIHHLCARFDRQSRCADGDFARQRFEQSCQGIEQGGFARAVVTAQHGAFARF